MEKFPHLFLPESMTKTVPFPEPDHCTCDVTEGKWLLAVEEGYVLLTHETCNKPLYPDLMETVVMDESIQVTMTPEKETCSCRGTCDCTYWLGLKGV